MISCRYSTSISTTYKLKIMSEVAHGNCKMLKLLTGMKYSFPILFPFKHKNKKSYENIAKFKAFYVGPIIGIF